MNDLNDTLYWAILTLTGIGQPFEVVTAGGRVATVLSIAVALIVVPGQLAKLATVAGAQDLIAGMGMGEDDDEDDYEDEGTTRTTRTRGRSTDASPPSPGGWGVARRGSSPRRDGSARLVGRHPGHRRRAVATEYSRDAPEGVGRARVRSVRAADPRGGCEILPAVRRSAGTDGIGGTAVREAERDDGGGGEA